MKVGRGLSNDGEVFAHELGHNYGMRHVRGCDSPLDPNDNYPWIAGRIGLNTAGAYTLNPASTLEVVSFIARDVMTYCDSVFMSDYTYVRIHQAIESGTVPPESGDQHVWPAGQSFALIAGSIDTATNAVTLLETLVQSDLGDAVGPDIGSYAIQFRDAGDAIIYSQSFDPTAISESESVRLFTEVVPWLPQTAMIEIIEVDTSTTLATQAVSANAPTVTVTYPNGGETLSGSETFTWDGHDADGDTLTYIVQFSRDSGTQWTTIVAATEDESVTLDAADLPGTGAALLRVIATDGVNTARDDSDSAFNVEPKMPQVAIVAPESNTHFIAGEIVVLQGVAFDLEDGVLHGNAMDWRSDVDGSLGTGAELELTTLSAARHEITLSATDTDGNTVDASVIVTVGIDDGSENLYLPYVTNEETGLDLQVNGLVVNWDMLFGGK